MNFNFNLETIILITAAALVGIGLGILIASTIIRNNIQKKGKDIIKDAERQADTIK
jgi:hypothetical protein